MLNELKPKIISNMALYKSDTCNEVHPSYINICFLEEVSVKHEGWTFAT